MHRDHRIAKQKKQSMAGFTLLEVMIAFSIIAIVITSLWGLHARTIDLNLHAQFDTQAPYLAEDRMAQVVEKLNDHDDQEEGDFGEDFPGYRWQSTVQKVKSESLGELTEKIRKVEVTVLFNQGEFRYSVVSYHLIQE